MSSAPLVVLAAALAVFTTWGTVLGGDAYQRWMFARWGERLVVNLVWGATVAALSMSGFCTAAILAGIAPGT